MDDVGSTCGETTHIIGRIIQWGISIMFERDRKLAGMIFMLVFIKSHEKIYNDRFPGNPGRSWFVKLRKRE